MRKLLNTLYVTSENSYLSLDGENVVVLEEVCRGSGVAQELAWQLNRLRPDCRVDCLDLGHRYIPHGSMQDLYDYCRLDGKSVAEYVLEVCQNEN